MSESAKIESLFPPSLADAQERNSVMFTQASEILTRTARALWESQTELFRLEAEQAARTIVPAANDADPAVMTSALFHQWHDAVEATIGHMRRVNDLTRNCGWELFALAAAQAWGREARTEAPVRDPNRSRNGARDSRAAARGT